MERLVGDLLVLASVDEGARAPMVPVDLDEIVLEEATRSAVRLVRVIGTSACRPVQSTATP